MNAIYQKTGLVTFHGTDAKKGNPDEYFDSPYSHEEFRKRFIEGNRNIGRISEWREVRAGRAKGTIIGGNLRCLLKLAGTEYMPSFRDKILILETYSSKTRETLFLLTQLKQMAFDEVAGIVVGHIYGMDSEAQYDRDGKRVRFEDILLEMSAGYTFPILKMHEFGHKCPSTFLPIGTEAVIDKGLFLTGDFLHKA
ncbi:MAG: hypothetical protein ACQESG_01675 [Nanobdellota archaeon]